MSFTHGKNARLFVDSFDLTGYFNEFVMAAKAGPAETTVFGKGAKTYIGGLQEGQISAKGFFDAGATANDQEMAAALGRATNMSVTFSPNGGLTPGSRAVVAFAAETDYTITTPVTNAVSVTFSAQADSGLITGVIVHDPSNAIVSATTTGNASTTATGVVAGGQLPVTSTAGFLPVGGLVVQTSTTPAYITYTSIVDGTHFGGVTVVTAGGVISTGTVVQAIIAGPQAGATTVGVVLNLHVFTFSGTGSPTITVAKVQHSADGVTWVDLAAFAVPITAVGAQSTTVANGVIVNQYLRSVLTTTGATISTTALLAVARQ